MKNLEAAIINQIKIAGIEMALKFFQDIAPKLIKTEHDQTLAINLYRKYFQ